MTHVVPLYGYSDALSTNLALRISSCSIGIHISWILHRLPRGFLCRDHGDESEGWDSETAGGVRDPSVLNELD